jgi:hypothetical protein
MKSLSRARSAFHRRSPRRAPLREPDRETLIRWPTDVDPHVFIEVRKPRLDPSTPLFAGASRPHALPRLLQRMFQRAQPRTARTSQTHGIRDPGTEPPIDRSLPLDRGTKPPRLRRVRGRGSPNLDIPFRDCSQKRLRPNPDRLRLLASRAWTFILSGVDSDQEPYRQRCLRLQGEDSERAVRRPISAKKSDVHQPEGPSIARSFANERGTSPNSARLLSSVAPTPFSLLRIRARDARRGV